MSLSSSMLSRLHSLKERHEELSVMLSDPEVIGARERFRALSQEYAELEPVARALQEYQACQAQLAGAQALLDDADPDLRELAQADIEELEATQAATEDALKQLLVPRDPDDSLNVFLEVRAGTGGDEAAIFAGDLFRMYSRYAEQQGWEVEVLSANAGEHGGYRR
jgi:peptide chain release factor 1